ncbi:MAG: zinc ribbon domain-containing protein, partial [Phycisphaerales bacterium]
YNGRTGGAEVRNKYGALLRGLLRCKACGYAMSHTFARGQGRRMYHRYYRCIESIKSGAIHCPSKTLPALEIERVVVEEVRRLGEDRDLLKRVLVDAERLVAGELGELRKERSGLTRYLERHHAALGRLAQSGITSADVALRVADLNEVHQPGTNRRAERALAAHPSDRVCRRIDDQRLIGPVRRCRRSETLEFKSDRIDPIRHHPEDTRDLKKSGML